ncbi:hypothetical protein [Acidilobus sp.]|uniref:hypothetical protein n=1 Tax=Acidilobus sp. TaxID=1872109 RepID=UPI003D066DF5
MAKLQVRWFKRRTLTIGPVELEVMNPVADDTVEAGGNVLDSILTEADKLMRDRKGDFVIIVGETPETKYIIGEGVRDRAGTRQLSALPKRLLKLAVIRLGSLSSVQTEGMAKFSLSSLEWYDAPPDTYIFDGPLKTEDDVEYVVFQLEDGVRIVRAPRLARLLLSLRPPVSQDQESQGDGSEEGEGSSPEG